MQRPTLPMCEELDLAVEAVHARVRTCAWKGRIALLALLIDGPKDVSELSEGAGLDLCTTSRHLKALRIDGLLTCTRDGKQKNYSFSPAVCMDVQGSHIAITIRGNWGVAMSLMLPAQSFQVQYKRAAAAKAASSLTAAVTPSRRSQPLRARLRTAR